MIGFYCAFDNYVRDIRFEFAVKHVMEYEHYGSFISNTIIFSPNGIIT